jgi:hypothetical protein
MLPYDIRRLSGVAAVLLAVTVCLAGYGLILQSTIGRASSWITLRSQTFNVALSQEKVFQRLLGLKRELGTDRNASEGRLGLLFGASTLKQGVDPSILNVEVGGGYRWTQINVSGQAHETALVNRLTFEIGLKPKVVVLVVNPGILVADANLLAERGWYDPGLFLEYVKRRKIDSARAELATLTMVPWNLAFPYRGRVFTLVDRELFHAKLRMLKALGQGIEALATPEADPWLNEYPEGLIQAKPAGNESILKFIGYKGWFDPANYRADGPNFALLTEFFRLAHENQAKTFLVFVPESSMCRAKLPASAIDHFTHTLAETLDEAAPVIFDYREAAPDQDFIDVNHLSPEGRAHFSPRLAAAMRQSLGTGGPPKP